MASQFKSEAPAEPRTKHEEEAMLKVSAIMLEIDRVVRICEDSEKDIRALVDDEYSSILLSVQRTKASLLKVRSSLHQDAYMKSTRQLF